MEKLQKTLADNAIARWTVLVLVASMMFFAYMFVDILSPLASLLEETPHLGWDRGVFGTYAAGEYLLSVFRTRHSAFPNNRLPLLESQFFANGG